MAIGVDIGATAVRAAQLRRRRDGSLILQRYGEAGLPPDAVVDGEVVDTAAVSQALRSLWRQAGFNDRAVAVGISSHRVAVRQLDLPELQEDELREAVRFQAADQLPFSVDDALIDHVVVGRPVADERPGVRALLVATERERVDGLLEAVEEAKLRPVLLDLEAFALIRSLATSLVVSNGAELVVDAGATNTTIVAHRAAEPLFVRMLRLGGDTVTRQLQETLDMEWHEAEDGKLSASAVWAEGGQLDPEDQRRMALNAGIRRLVAEVQRSHDYAAAQHPDVTFQRLVLAGGGSLVPTLAEQLESGLNLPVDRAAPLEATGLAEQEVPVEVASPTAEALMPVAVGLALGVLA